MKMITYYKTTNTPKYPNLHSLHDIVIEDSNNRQQQPNPNDSMTSFRLVIPI